MDSHQKLRETIDRAANLYEAGDSVAALSLLSSLKFDGDVKKSPLFGRFLCVLGSAQAELGHTDHAIGTFELALQCEMSHGDTEQIGLLNFNLGNVFKYAGNHRNASVSYEKAVENFQAIANYQMLLMTLLALAHTASELSDWSGVRDYLKRCTAITIADELLNPAVAWSRHSLQAQLARVDAEEQVAVEHARKAVYFARMTGLPRYSGESLIGLAELLARAGQLEEARALATEARSILRTSSEQRATLLGVQAQQLLARVNNLDFAFGTETDSKPYGMIPRILPGHTYLADLGEPHGVENDPPLAIAEDGGANRSHLISQLKQYADRSSRGILCVFASGKAYILPHSKPGVTAMDVENPETWKDLTGVGSAGLAYSGIKQLSIEISGLGLKQKATGTLEAAVYHYCFAMRLALRINSIPGADTLGGNLFILWCQLLTEVKHRRRSLWGSIQTASATAGSVLMGGATNDFVEQACDMLRDFIAQQAKAMLAEAGSETGLLSLPSEATTELPKLRLRRRLRSLMSKPEEPDSLIEILRVSETLGELEVGAESLYEALVETDFLEILWYFGLAGHAANRVAEGKSSPDPATATNFETIWELYLNWRRRAVRPGASYSFVAAVMAIEHFDLLRSRSVAGGGAFGHRLSYEVAQLGSRVARDAIQLLVPEGGGGGLDSLALAEQASARALTDWMGRTHANNRLVLRGLTGSVGEIASASAEEILQLSAQTGPAILYYISVNDGYILWGVFPDGACLCLRLSGVSEVLARLFHAFPFTFRPPVLSRVKSTVVAAASGIKAKPITSLLLEVAQLLIPLEVRSRLTALGVKTLAIIADQTMQFVPFACLLLDDGLYLTDQFSIVYWPSVTAYLLCLRAEARYASSDTESPASLILAAPDFTSSFSATYRGLKQQITLEPLPGAQAEAALVGRIINATPRTGGHATFDALMMHYYPYRNLPHEQQPPSPTHVPILHLATHGVSDSWDPAESFVALTDRLLTAEFLYDFDPGFHTRLVMLSCCQTALGYVHPDSIRGIANAFLVAGACTVGSTLWNVDDDASVVFMGRFYSQLAQGHNVADASVAAQREVRSHREWAHPFYWAPFKMSGSYANPLSRNK